MRRFGYAFLMMGMLMQGVESGVGDAVNMTYRDVVTGETVHLPVIAEEEIEIAAGLSTGPVFNESPTVSIRPASGSDISASGIHVALYRDDEVLPVWEETWSLQGASSPVPVREDGNYSLRVYYFRIGMNGMIEKGEETEKVFRIDTTVPVINELHIGTKTDDMRPVKQGEEITLPEIQVHVSADVSDADETVLMYCIHEEEAAVNDWAVVSDAGIIMPADRLMYLSFQAEDTAGNQSSVFTVGPVRVDLTPPNLTVESVTSMQRPVAEEICLRGTVKDDTGIRALHWRIPGMPPDEQEEVFLIDNDSTVLERDFTLTIPRERLSGDEVTVLLTATDVFGRTSTQSVGPYVIDGEAPTIHVSYMDGSPGGGLYSVNGPIRITVTDAHPDTEKSKVYLFHRESGMMLTYDDWTETADGMVLSVSGLPDGTYQLTADVRDTVGHQTVHTESADFRIDTTPPVICIEPTEEVPQHIFDNKPRTFRITVWEAHFLPSGLVIEHEADGKKQWIAGESLPWRSDGDTHVAKYTVTAAGQHRIDVSLIDAAGHASAVKSERPETDFILDYAVDTPIFSGLDEGILYTGRTDFSILVTEPHLTDYSVTLVRADMFAPFFNMLHPAPIVEHHESGQLIIRGPNLPVTRCHDGIYVLTLKLSDAAGNTYERQCRFFVNRFGSFYALDEVLKQINGKLIQSVPGDLIVRRWNPSPDAPNASGLTILRNGVPLPDIKVQDIYRPFQEPIPFTANRYERAYVIRAENFQADGHYIIRETGRDVAGHVDTLTGQFGQDVAFTVDGTLPEVLDVTGMSEESGEKSRTITVSAFDASGIEEMSMTANGESLGIYTAFEDPHRVHASWTVAGEGEKRMRLIIRDKAGNVLDTDDMDASEVSGFVPVMRLGQADIPVEGARERPLSKDDKRNHWYRAGLIVPLLTFIIWRVVKKRQ